MRKQSIRDFLQDIDAVLQDNSIERQAKIKHVEDLVCNPTQSSSIEYRDTVSLDFFERSLRVRLDEMARRPQSPDTEPFADCGIFPFWNSPLAHPDYSRDWGEDADFFNEEGIPWRIYVDGIQYTSGGSESMATFKDVVQW